MCMSVAEYAIIKERVRVNAPLEFWVCTYFPRYHEYMFHTYRKSPNKMNLDVAERAKRSIQEYIQHNSEMGGNRGPQVIQVQ